MPTVHLVRHAMPYVDPSVPPDRWVLSEEGRAAAAALRLPAAAHRLASPEPKAVGTLALALPGPVVTDARFGEVRRPAEAIGPTALVARRDWVAGRLDDRHAGWERPVDAAARFGAAVGEAPCGDLVVATHGMVLTAWLVATGVVAPGEAAARFWSALGLPDVVVVPRPGAGG